MKQPSKLLLSILLIFITGCNLPAPVAGNPTLIPGTTAILTQPPPVLPTFTPEPTPTPVPAVRIVNADRALFYGDYSLARSEYQTAFETSGETEVRAAALLGLARVDYAEANYASALALLRTLTTDYPGTISLPSGFFLLGESYFALGRYQEAAETYTSYMTLRPGLIDSYVYEKIGDGMLEIGSYTDAVAAYNAAIQAPHLGDNLGFQVKIAQTYAAANDLNAALALYDQIFAQTSNDFLKAQMDLLAGRAHLQRGESELAYQRFSHAVENYPRAFDSYSALVALVDAGVPVSEFDRGVVDYYAGQYNLALAALNRYIENNPEHDGSAYHFRALTLRALGEYQAAVDSWTVLGSRYLSNRYWVEAWREKAFTQWAYMSQLDAAAQTLLDFANRFSAHAEAPRILFEAARIQERNQQFAQAVESWERLADTYPSSDLVSQSIFLAGITRYRMGDFRGAEINFQRNFLLAGSPGEQAKNLFWIGKAQEAQGKLTEANETWQRALTYDSTGYYSERARDKLLDREPFENPSVFNLEYDLDAERREAYSWVRLTFNMAPDTDLSNPGALANDLRFKRGTEFWELGLYDLARLEFEDLRKAVANDPADSFRLANYMLDLGLYRPAIFAARQVLNLAGMDDAATLTAPSYFNHVRFGTYYSEIILPAAEESSLHPLFMFAVVRQESLFEGFVRSSAGARGLMQIIPSTGEALARNLNWPPGYDSDDLYRPLVSVRLGADYLRNNLANFGDYYTTLAAYNAGPGNASIWQNLSGTDQDLFLEIVRFSETQNYIRGIYEVFYIYRNLYSPTP